MPSRGRNKFKSILQASGTAFNGENVPTSGGTAAVSAPQVVDAEVIGFALDLTTVTASNTTVSVQVSLDYDQTTPTWADAWREPTGTTAATVSAAGDSLSVIYLRNPFPPVDGGEVAWRLRAISAETTAAQTTFGRCYVFARGAYPNESLDA